MDILKHLKPLIKVIFQYTAKYKAFHLVEVVHGLDVVVGQAEPGEQVDVLQPLDGHQVVRREVENLV